MKSQEISVEEFLEEFPQDSQIHNPEIPNIKLVKVSSGKYSKKSQVEYMKEYPQVENSRK